MGLGGADSGLAQPNILAVSVDVQDPQAPLRLDHETLLDVTVRNQGTMNGTVRLNATAQVTGWYAEMTTQRVDLAAGEARTIPVRVSAPATWSGASSGSDVTVRAALSEMSGQLTARNHDTTHVDLAEPARLATESSGWLLPGGLWVGIVLLSGAVLWRVHSSKGELMIDVGGERTLRAGEEAHLRVRVWNPTDETQDVALHLEGVPDGWPVALGTSHLTLAAKQHTGVWLSIAPPEASQSYPVMFRIVAEPMDEDVRPGVAALDVRVEADEGLWIQ